MCRRWRVWAGALYRDQLVNRMIDRQTRLKTLPFRNFVGGGNYLLLINPYTDTFHTVSQFYLLASTGDPPPNILQEAQIRVLELADCQERYSSTPFQVYNESICVFKLNDDDDHTGSCYVSIQTLAMSRPPTVTARNKQEKNQGWCMWFWNILHQ